MKTLFVVASLALGLGCGHGPFVAPVRASVGTPGGVRIQLRQVTGNILKFVIFNDTADNLVIDRNQATVHGPGGEMHRMPGGSEGTYPLPAGGVHDLNVRFDFKEVPEGTQLEVHLEKAIQNKGQPIHIDPIIVVRK